jgi:hypothetical protein
MLRQPCLDAPDPRHHVRVRGLERRAIFKDDAAAPARAPCVALAIVITRVCRQLGLAPDALTGGAAGPPSSGPAPGAPPCGWRGSATRADPSRPPLGVSPHAACTRRSPAGRRRARSGRGF